MVLTHEHATISSVGNGVDVRWYFVTFLSLVQFHYLLRVDRQTLVRVDNDAEQPGIGLQTKCFTRSCFYVVLPSSRRLGRAQVLFVCLHGV